MSAKEIAVFGAGPAGIATTKKLAQLGHNVTWIIPEKFVDRRSIYTTVKDYQELGDITSPSDQLPIPHIRLVNDKGADFLVNVEGNPYFMIDNLTRTEAAVKRLENNPNVILEKHPPKDIKQIQVTENKTEINVRLAGGSKNFDSVVDATGVEASIAKQVDKTRLLNEGNFLVMYLFGGKIKGNLDRPEMILATGGEIGTSWVCPSIDPGYIDIVFGSWSPINDSQKFFSSAKQRFAKLLDFTRILKGVHIESDNLSEFYHGMLRAQPTERPKTSRLFAVGEAAGMGEPSTGRVFDRSYHAGILAAEAIDSNQSPEEFYKTWRNIWKDDLLFAGTMARLPFQKIMSVGGTFSLLHELSQSDKHNRVIEKAIEWLVKAKLSPEALIYLLTNPKLLIPYVRVLNKYLEIKIKGVNQSSGLAWSLPDVKED